MPSESFLQVKQHFTFLGYVVVPVHDTMFIAMHPQHKLMVAEDTNFIYLMNKFLPKDSTDVTFSNLITLANYGNQRSGVTRFFVEEDRNFIGLVLYTKPYDAIRFGWILDQMKADFLKLTTSHLIGYLK